MSLLTARPAAAAAKQADQRCDYVAVPADAQSDWSPAENVLMRRGCLVLLSSQNNYGSYFRELLLTAPLISKQGSKVQASESATILEA